MLLRNDFQERGIPPKALEEMLEKEHNKRIHITEDVEWQTVKVELKAKSSRRSSSRDLHDYASVTVSSPREEDDELINEFEYSKFHNVCFILHPRTGHVQHRQLHFIRNAEQAAVFYRTNSYPVRFIVCVVQTREIRSICINLACTTHSNFHLIAFRQFGYDRSHFNSGHTYPRLTPTALTTFGSNVGIEISSNLNSLIVWEIRRNVIKSFVHSDKLKFLSSSGSKLWNFNWGCCQTSLKLRICHTDGL